MSRIFETEAFIQVVESGSFTEAAKRLDVTKSYASKLVSRLEDRLGVKLLHRSTRRLAMTEAGQAYHERCTAVLEALEEAEMAATELQRRPRGRLRVTAPAMFGADHLMHAFAEFKATYPELLLELNFSDRRVDLLGEGFDLAVRAGDLRGENLTVRRLATSPMFPCASAEYIARRGMPREPEELAKHECLLYAHEALPDTWPLHNGEREVAVTVSGSLVANHAKMLLDAASAGLGIVFVPLFHSEPYLRDARLLRVVPGWERNPVVPIYIVYPPTRFVPAKTRVFIDFMVRYFKTPPWSSVCES